MNSQENVSCDIVTVCKNNPVGMSLTLDSLFQQDHHNWNVFLVVPKDDPSLAEVSGYLKDPRVNILRDLGEGIYSAMNLAVMSLKSPYVWFLNGGDQLFGSDSLRVALNEIIRTNADLLIGDFVLENSDKHKFRFPYVNKIETVSARKLAISINRTCHQSSLFRVAEESHRPLYYDTKYHFAADFELMLRFAKFGRSVFTPRILSVIEGNGMSDENIESVWLERGNIRRTYFPVIGLLWTFVLGWAFKVHLVFGRYVKRN